MTTAPNELVNTLDGEHIETDEVWLPEKQERAITLTVADLPGGYLLLSIDMAKQLVHDLVGAITEDDEMAVKVWEMIQQRPNLQVVR